MKTKTVFSAVTGLGILLLTFSACRKNHGTENTGSLLPSDSIVTSKGFVGLVIDTRPMAKKGYKPAKAQVNFTGNFAAFSKEVIIHPLTNIGTLAIAADNLTAAQLSQLANGVSVNIKISDNNGTQLTEYNGNADIDASNKPLTLTTQQPKIFPELGIKAGVPYYIQAITDEVNAKNKLLTLVGAGGTSSAFDGIINLYDYNYINSNNVLDRAKYYFHPLGGNQYNISVKSATLNNNNANYLKVDNTSGMLRPAIHFGANPGNDDNFIFELGWDENGRIKIKPVNYAPLSFQVTNNSTVPVTVAVNVSNSADTYLPFRIVAANVQWNVADRGTEYNAPIAPAAVLEFAYKSTLENCSPATLTQTVGSNKSETKSFKIGTEESLQLFTSHTASVSVTTGVEAGFNLFGADATASVSTTVGYAYTTSVTATTTNTWEQTIENTVAVSVEREIQVPPFTALEVYDAIQTINDVKMPFVQKIRVQGSYDGMGSNLSGNEIVSQLLANQFDGVITAVGNDYADITIKGTATIGKYFVAKTRSGELKGRCN